MKRALKHSFCTSMPPTYKNYSALKLTVLLILLSFTLLFLHNLNSGVSPLSNTTSIQNSEKTQELRNGVLQDREAIKDCDLFNGEWVPSESGPIYTNETCSFIDGERNCLLNGRSDKGYLYWKWSPYGCELPRFDPRRFLWLMNNKVLGLIGDSISRNHAQSLVCMLSTVEKAVMVYHDKSYKNRRWLFPSFNFTISLIWSPLLAKATTFENDDGVASAEMQIHLDVLDNSWTDHFSNFDYMIFSTGDWFMKSAIYYENNIILGCHYCPKRNLTEIGYTFAHRKVVRKVFDFIVASKHKGKIIYRTITPNHFENGDWTTGGTCNRNIPAKAGEIESNGYDKDFRDTELEEFNRVSAKAYESGVNLKFFNVSYLALLRPDGHVGQYRPFQTIGSTGKPISDCLHWCVPGPIDYWNDLLMEMLLERV